MGTRVGFADDPRWDDLLDAMLKLLEKHPDWRGELVAAIEAAHKKGARSS